MKIFIMNRYKLFVRAAQRPRIPLTDNIYRAGAAVVSTITSLHIWSLEALIWYSEQYFNTVNYKQIIERNNYN